MSTINIGIITVSDRASAGIYEDLSGKAIMDTLDLYLKSDYKKVYKIIPDEQDIIEKTIINMVDNEKCCLVVTTGGNWSIKKRRHSRSNRSSL